jgi:hypothetical protein
MTTVSAGRAASSEISLSNSCLKWLLAIDTAVCFGGASGTSSIPASGAFPTSVDAFTNDAEDDLRDSDTREGDRAEDTPPTPWREFIEAFLCRVGEVDRVSRLMTLGLRRRGLRCAALPFGDDGRVFRCPRFLVEGEEGCGDGGRTVEEAVLIERRFSACESEVSFLFIEGGKGAGEGDPFTPFFRGESAIAHEALQSLRQ